MTNLAYKANFAILNKLNVNNPSYNIYSYTQTYNHTYVTNDGFHIVRDPNISYSGSENNGTYGGLYLLNSSNATNHIANPSIDNTLGLEKGHTYFLIYRATGRTVNSSLTSHFHNKAGWSGGGLTPAPSNISYRNIIGNSDDTVRVDGDYFVKFTINDDIYKVCTSAYTSPFIVGETYLSYFGIGIALWTYGATGAGTDIYINNVRLYDVTNSPTFQPSQNGEVFTPGVIERDVTNAKILKSGELLTSQLIEY